MAVFVDSNWLERGAGEEGAREAVVFAGAQDQSESAVLFDGDSDVEPDALGEQTAVFGAVAAMGNIPVGDRPAAKFVFTEL